MDPLSVAGLQSVVQSPRTWDNISPGSPAEKELFPPSPSPSPSKTGASDDSDNDSLYVRETNKPPIELAPAISAYLRAEDTRAKFVLAAKSAAAEKKRLAPEAALAMSKAGVQKMPLADGGTLSTFVPKPSKPKVTTAALRTAVQKGLAAHFAIPLSESSALLQNFEAAIPPPASRTGGGGGGGDEQRLLPTVHRSYKRKLGQIERVSTPLLRDTNIRKNVVEAFDRFVAASPRSSPSSVITPKLAAAAIPSNGLFRMPITWAETQAAIAKLRSKPLSPNNCQTPSPTALKSEIGKAALLANSIPHPHLPPPIRIDPPSISKPVLVTPVATISPLAGAGSALAADYHRSLPLSPSSPTVSGSEIGAAALASLK